jgi:voltage-gated potassium channel
MAYVAEHSANPGFADFGDALWWGVVTLTTVGYGDIVPDTTKGRVAGVFLMVTGIATLGLISGTLASMFRRASTPEPVSVDTSAHADVAAVHEELGTLRVHLEAIERHLAALAGGTGREPPPPPV